MSGCFPFLRSHSESRRAQLIRVRAVLLLSPSLRCLNAVQSGTLFSAAWTLSTARLSEAPKRPGEFHEAAYMNVGSG